jgi:hypothetical protein
VLRPSQGLLCAVPSGHEADAREATWQLPRHSPRAAIPVITDGKALETAKVLVAF